MNIKLKLKSLDLISLNIYSFYLKKVFNQLNFTSSFCNLPKKRKFVTLLKSPHVNKAAREQFSMHTYFKIITIKNVNEFNFLKHITLNKPKHISLTLYKQ